MRTSVKRVVVAGAVLAITAGAGTAAYAAWLATGKGHAYAQAGEAVELTTEKVDVLSTLYPGVTGDASITVNNENPYPVLLTSINWNPADGVQANPVKGRECGNTGVYFGDFSAGPVGTNGVLDVEAKNFVVPAGKSATFDLADSVRMINNSENGCQGATFKIKVSLAGKSAAQ